MSAPRAPRWWVRLVDREQAESWRRHDDPTTGPRLARLDDNPVSTLMGTADWCDGRLLPCPLCGRCCPCRHTSREPGYTEEHR